MIAKCVACPTVGMYVCSERVADWNKVDEYAYENGFARNGEGKYLHADGTSMSGEMTWMAAGMPARTPCWRTKDYFDEGLVGESSPILDGIVAQTMASGAK